MDAVSLLESGYFEREGVPLTRITSAFQFHPVNGSTSKLRLGATPQSIDQKLAQLTKDLELTPKQQKQVRPLLEEHRDKIQALLDKNPKASRGWPILAPLVLARVGLLTFVFGGLPTLSVPEERELVPFVPFF